MEARMYAASFGCHLLLMFLVRRFFPPWWWRLYVPTKRLFLQEPHGASHPKRRHSSRCLVDKVIPLMCKMEPYFRSWIRGLLSWRHKTKINRLVDDGQLPFQRENTSVLCKKNINALHDSHERQNDIWFRCIYSAYPVSTYNILMWICDMQYARW
jgi:hypothetical protein